MKVIIALLCFVIFIEVDDIRRQIHNQQSATADTGFAEMFNREVRRGRNPRCPGGECPPGDGGDHGHVGEPGTPDFRPKPPEEEPETPPQAPIDDETPTPPSETKPLPIVTLPPPNTDEIKKLITANVAIFQTEINNLKTQVTAAQAQANKPFWIRVVDPRGKYTTEPQKVYLGQQIDLKLEPITGSR